MLLDEGVKNTAGTGSRSLVYENAFFSCQLDYRV